ncbi:protein lethal(2)essential for life-like isoform X2 [Ischnura elegans]|uniref:protein lethal(2)essential for life-like isoform X2 n=1 Tax=Ischnura elegans TaxID=197161 RepID=UPI001ED88438|nr:protein lethal(2)essential for life-like isoform X2 [Ischnura elegans]
MSRHALAFRPWFAANPWAPAPSQLFDQHFRHGMHMDDLFQPPYIPYHAPPTHHRPWRHLPRADDSRGAMDKDGLKIVVDVQHFKLGEITVKQEEDCVVVEGKHEETEDEHDFVSRHFVRRYTLPQGVDHQALNSTLSSDGVLTITAPKVGVQSVKNM